MTDPVPPKGPCPFAMAAIGVPARRWSTRTDLLKQLDKAREFLETCPVDSTRCLVEAAERAGLSVHHFLRLFHETYNITPTALLAKRRIERAKELLRGEMDIIEVAIEVGFENHSAFSRAFKKHVGLTPRAFRSTAV